MVEKVSQVTTKDIADFIHIDEITMDDEKQLSTILNVAKNYIVNYTGLENLDEYADLVIVVYVLCQDMWDNRTMYVDKGNVNRVVQTILDMHSRNLL